jgi:hypothetical protein
MTKTPEQIVAGLIDMEKERLLGWQGVAGAAYNAISEDLCEQGLLNSDWTLSETGLQCRAILQEQKP